MRVLLADDHREVLSALRLLLEDEAWLEVLGEAADADELQEQARALRPNLVLLDWQLPDGLSSRSGPRDAFSLLAALRQTLPEVLVVVLSGRPEARQAALAAGADGFASKGDSPERLLSLLRSFQS